MRAHTRRLRLSICLALFALILGACATAPPQTEGPVSEETTDAGQVDEPGEDTATGDLADFFGTPPAPILEIEGRTQTAGVGTYCWPRGDSGGQSVVCADTIGIITPALPITATSPVEGIIHLPIPFPPEQATLNIRPVTPADEVQAGNLNSLRAWAPQPGTSISLPLETDPSFSTELEPGLYLVDLFSVWPDLGDASFGFLVSVGPLE